MPNTALARLAAAAAALVVLTACAANGGPPPVPLRMDDPQARTIGRLAYRGGVELRLASPDFGGLSGMVVDADGSLLAVTDRAMWVTGRIELDPAGRLADVAGLAVAGPLAGTGGGALGTANHRGDSEALVRLADGSLLVAFERRHRLGRYGRPGGPAAPADAPKDLVKAPCNGGLESAARLPDGRLMLLAEQLRDGNGDFVGWVGRPGAWQAFAYAATGPYEPADAATGPDGRVYLLERRFNPLGGFGVRVTRFPAADLAPGARIEAEELAVFEPPYVQENFEAIAALADPAGGVRLYIASDDNFSFLQRTLLLAFRVAE